MRRILIVRAGLAPPPVRRRHGDFTDWFGELLRPCAEVAVADGVAGPLPDPWAHGGVLVTGSVASVTARAPWMEALGAWLLRAGERRPVLGVCFGHQLLAQALGGRVERHPAGPEAGTVAVELTEDGRADPLLRGLPSPLLAQEMHEDHVAAPPPGAVVLARTAHAPVQAFAHGPRLRGVQFHPEFDAERTRAFAVAARGWLEAGRAGLADEVLAGVRPAPEAASVVRRWAEAFVEG